MTLHTPHRSFGACAPHEITLRRLFIAFIAVLGGCASAPEKTSQPTWPSTPAAAAQISTDGKPAVPLFPQEPLQGIVPKQLNAQTISSLEPPKELWDRIRRGFSMPDLQTDAVAEREQWYAKKPEYIERMTARSGRYLFHIVEELERRQMPTELALLPFIESAFNPQAVSSAKAAGMWQFTPSTGKYFELKQNAFRDDRRDVLASTRAALDYLQKLHRMFGDWHLALAAYNWGEGSVSRAIARNQKAGLPTGYLDLNMPNETRQYVPKLQAIENIVANPGTFGAQLPFIGNHPYFQQIAVTRDIDVALAAKLADVKLDDFKALNPSAHKPVILASGTPYILLPWDKAAVFQRNFQAHNLGQYASWTTWVAPNTLSSSEAAKRVGMSETDLRSINNIPPRMLIKAGSTLLVPRSARVDTDVAGHVADNAQVSLAPQNVTRRTLVKARKGETVASIAKRYALAASLVAEWNGVGAAAAFKLGQSVVVFLPVKSKAVANANANANAKQKKGVVVERGNRSNRIQPKAVLKKAR